jgi:hypothetical protein
MEKCFGINQITFIIESMKNLVYILILLFAATACSKDSGTITGKASADGGKVVQGITVKLYDEKANFMVETLTDGQGNFSFSKLASGNYYVAATITVGSDVWDTGNNPQLLYVGDDIVKKVTLTLTKK